MKPAILITGAYGQLGQELQYLAPHFTQFDFVFSDRDTLDITNNDEVEAFFHQHHFKYCINCAAYTAVDKAETDKDLAYAINVVGAANLAANCALQNIHFTQISTDYVYHNEQNTPFKEGDAVNPQGVYALTKLQGDEASMRFNAHTTLVRTSWVYSTFGNNFVKTMLRLGAERPSLNVIFDQIGSPTYARDLGNALLNIIQKIENQEITLSDACGVFHYSNEGVTSWYDFAHAIFEIKGMNCKVNPIETVDYPTPAKRPPFSLMNKTKIKKTFALEIPHWRDSLKTMLNNLV